MKILIYGSRGYIGSIFTQYFLKEKITILNSNYGKIFNEEQVQEDINSLKPDCIVSCIGLTHNNQDNSTKFLNDPLNLINNLESNLFIHNLIFEVCKKNNIHFTYIGTGCIYNYTNERKKFSESDIPNCFNNNYSIVKSYTDRILALNKNECLVIRLRQCINNDNNPRNFLVKFLNLEKVSNIENSFTVIPDIFPLIIKLILKKQTGIFNCVNKGTITVKEINLIFDKKRKQIIEDDYILKNYANNEMSTEKLESMFSVPDIREGLINLKKTFKKI